MRRLITVISLLILAGGGASAQAPGRKYTQQNLDGIRKLFGTTTHDKEACAVRLYYYGETHVMLGVDYKATTAYIAYVDAQGRLTGEIAQYLIPVDFGGTFQTDQDTGFSENKLVGKDTELKYTWSSVPPEFNISREERQGTTYRRILSNWRRLPGSPPTDFETQCGPDARFCECIYNFPH